MLSRNLHKSDNYLGAACGSGFVYVKWGGGGGGGWGERVLGNTYLTHLAKFTLVSKSKTHI
jgi:hypothetical protein